jgi:hypothetical protein
MRPHEEKKKKIWDSWQILLRKQSFGDEFNWKPLCWISVGKPERPAVGTYKKMGGLLSSELD